MSLDLFTAHRYRSTTASLFDEAAIHPTYTLEVADCDGRHYLKVDDHEVFICIGDTMLVNDEGRIIGLKTQGPINYYLSVA